MALSSNSKQVLTTALTNKGASDAITDAVDANTLKTGVTAAASVTTTTTNATTTRLHTMTKALVASMKTAGLMS